MLGKDETLCGNSEEVKSVRAYFRSVVEVFVCAGSHSVDCIASEPCYS